MDRTTDRHKRRTDRLTDRFPTELPSWLTGTTKMFNRHNNDIIFNRPTDRNDMTRSFDRSTESTDRPTVFIYLFICLPLFDWPTDRTVPTDGPTKWPTQPMDRLTVSTDFRFRPIFPTVRYFFTNLTDLFFNRLLPIDRFKNRPIKRPINWPTVLYRSTDFSTDRLYRLDRFQFRPTDRTTDRPFDRPTNFIDRPIDRPYRPTDYRPTDRRTDRFRLTDFDRPTDFDRFYRFLPNDLPTDFYRPISTDFYRPISTDRFYRPISTDRFLPISTDRFLPTDSTDRFLRTDRPTDRPIRKILFIYLFFVNDFDRPTDFYGPTDRRTDRPTEKFYLFIFC